MKASNPEYFNKFEEALFKVRSESYNHLAPHSAVFLNSLRCHVAFPLCSHKRPWRYHCSPPRTREFCKLAFLSVPSLDQLSNEERAEDPRLVALKEKNEAFEDTNDIAYQAMLSQYDTEYVMEKLTAAGLNEYPLSAADKADYAVRRN